MLPSSVTRLRVVKIGDIDVCPCAGTHVRSLSEIGDVQFLKRDNKGSEKIRLSYKLND
jgi:misacylated tRNA(Ala) deacylase